MSYHIILDTPADIPQPRPCWEGRPCWADREAAAR
jgi:hypothetical protein